MCNICEDTGYVKMVPEAVGWVHVDDDTWRLPDGSKLTFPACAAQLLVAMCPECFPSLWPRRHTLN